MKRGKKCVICGKTLKSYNGVMIHAARLHKLNPADYHENYLHDRQRCACGCGELVEWDHGKSRWNEYIFRHRWTGKTGEDHPVWKGGHLKCGYVVVYVGNGKQRYEHRIIGEAMVGHKLKRNEIVHHIDGNKTNNDPGNLQVMTRAEHIMLHNSS